MGKFKLSTVEELFPDKAEKLEEKEKKENYGRMFKISSDKKKHIVEFLKRCVEESQRQREQWLQIRSESIRNYEGMRREGGPWEGSSNISTMITTIASDMIHGKLFPMVWNPDLIYWKGTTSHNEEVAENNRIFAQWFLTKDMEDAQELADDIIQSLVLDGTVAVKRRWEKTFHYVTRVNPVSFTEKGEIKYEIVYDKIQRQRARWEVKDIEHVYLPYNAKNEDDAEYVIDENFYTLPMLKEMQARKMILDDVDMDEVKTAIIKRYDPEGGKQARLDSAGIEAYTARVESMPIRCWEGCVKYDINDDNIREECVFLALPDINVYLGGKPLHTVSRIGKRPWRIGQFLRRKGVVYGKGIPELVRHLHAEMDAIHNQRIDAGNMVIAPFFFYRAASGFDPKEIAVKPATGIPLDDPQRDVYFPDYNPSRLSVSFQEEGMILDLIEKLTYLTPAMLGRETASRPTARGTLAVIAQGEERFNPLAARVLKFVLGLITDTRKMYEEHWDNNYAKMILSEDGKQMFGVLSPEMIAGDYSGFSEVDLEKSNAAFEAQADQLMFQSLAQDPFVNQNPAFAWQLRANYIRSLGKKNVEKFIGPKPDYEDNPGIVDDENQMFLQEIDVKVGEKDDDVAHINGHTKFKREMFSVLTPEALTRITMHIMEHRFKYTQKLQESAMVYGGRNASQGQNSNSGALGAPRMGTVQGPRVPGSSGGQPGSPPVPAQPVPGGPGSGGPGGG